MPAVQLFLTNCKIDHRPIRVAFTPDEEIGRGVNPKIPKDLKVDFAYPYDGGQIGEIQSETFCADSTDFTIIGVPVHPRLAEGKLVSAIHLATKIISKLPEATMTPETT